MKKLIMIVAVGLVGCGSSGDSGENRQQPVQAPTDTGVPHDDVSTIDDTAAAPDTRTSDAAHDASADSVVGDATADASDTWIAADTSPVVEGGDACATCASPPHAAATCTDGTCGFTCDSGYADCNKIASDGCESRLDSDPTSCGGCGTACPTPDASLHEVATCTASVCGTACDTEWAHCIGPTFKGCQTNITNDPGNCGACGTACPWDRPYCVSSVCSATP